MCGEEIKIAPQFVIAITTLWKDSGRNTSILSYVIHTRTLIHYSHNKTYKCSNVKMVFFTHNLS